jgi:pteridine reductase
MTEGAVVNVVDVAARRPQARFAAYCGAKAALWAVTEALALELAPRIRVNGVAPGHMLWAEGEPLSAAQQARELQRVPLQRLGGAEPVARAVRFLLSADAAYLTGAVLPVDGGLHLQ